MQALESENGSNVSVGVTASANTAGAAGAMIAAVAAGMVAPAVLPVLGATALGFGLGKIVGLFAADHEKHS